MFILDNTLAQVPSWFQTPSVTPKSDVEKAVERLEKQISKDNHDQFIRQVAQGTAQSNQGYQKTPVELEVEKLEQQLSQEHQQLMQRNNTQVQTTGPADILGLQPSGHNTFTRPGFSGKWIRQLDGSLFYEGGKHTETNTPLNPGTYVNGQPLPNRTTPLLGTREIAELNLTRNQDGTFSNSEIRGKFLLQWDGSMYFTGGLDKNGQVMAPYTYKSGSDADTTKFNPLPSTVGIAQGGLIPNPDGVTFNKSGFPGRYIPQVDGTIFYTGGNTISNGAPVLYKPQTFIPGQGIDQSRTTGHLITQFILKMGIERDKDGNLSYVNPRNRQKTPIKIEGDELLWTGRTTTGAIKTFKFIGFDATGSDKWQIKP